MNDPAAGLSAAWSPNTLIPDGLIEALSSIAPEGSALHEPEFSGNETRYVEECISSGWVSSVGKFVDQFEAGLATDRRAGRRHRKMVQPLSTPPFISQCQTR